MYQWIDRKLEIKRQIIIAEIMSDFKLRHPEINPEEFELKIKEAAKLVRELTQKYIAIEASSLRLGAFITLIASIIATAASSATMSIILIVIVMNMGGAAVALAYHALTDAGNLRSALKQVVTDYEISLTKNPVTPDVIPAKQAHEIKLHHKRCHKHHHDHSLFPKRDEKNPANNPVTLSELEHKSYKP